MSGIGEWLLRLLAWSFVYAVLLLGYSGLTRAVSAWVRRQRRLCPTIGSLPGRLNLVQGAGMAVALAAGAMIPLAPDVAWSGRMLSFHLWGDADAALLLVLALQWIGMALLSLSASPSRWGENSGHVAMVAGRLGVQAVLIVLLVFSLLLTSSVPDDLTTHLTAWMSAQDGVWLGVVQPVAFLVWLFATAPSRYDGRGRSMPGGQVLALNHALLTSIFFLGGWSGPFVQTWPWLGGPYLALKVGLVTIFSTWQEVSFPPVMRERGVWAAWRVAVPVALINLFVTGLVLALI
ncbi:MAG: NADH-quinone oxidoreductase subunit H [Anaerolineae bacterium]|nr:NADH-quinone oxidoreductase subunit H [Anaerolineae bacterium]